MKYLFMIEGVATKADKVRCINVGDVDVHAIISDESEDPTLKCTLTEPKIVSKKLLGKDWQT